MNTYIIRATEKVAPAPIHCIPNAPARSGGEALTICGWVDVPYREEEAEPDCPDCLAIVAYCKGLKVRT